VVSAAKMNCRQTRLLFETVPPGTATHALPSQYCASKARRPQELNVIVGVG
jgi:hypothetical protein